MVYRDGLVCGSTGKSALDATAPLDGPREAIDAFAQRFFQNEQAKYTAWLANLPLRNTTEEKEITKMGKKLASRRKGYKGKKKPAAAEEEGSSDGEEN